jgi:hypothetical protein
MRNGLLALTALSLAAAAPAAAAKPRCASTLSAAQVPVGGKVTLAGTIRPKGKVALQARGATRWVTITTKRSSKRGRFSFTVPTKTAGTVAIRARGRRACSAKTLTITAAPAGVDAPPAWRAVYALASDQTEDPGKVAAIRATHEAVNGWFATQTVDGVRPRWFRDSGGAIAVTVVRLAHTRAEYDAAGDSYDMVDADLRAAGLPAGGDKLAVWIDVSNSGACGATRAGVVIMFEAACDIHPSTADAWPQGGTYLVAHEMAHGFGAVQPCAPHSIGGGHVGDDPKDLLYAGDQPRDWDHITLDPGRDDYYGPFSADCPGIESSPYWTATSDPLS